MSGYVLVSCADERGVIWRPTQSAIKNLTAAANQPRADSRATTGLHPRITEAEMALRRERHAVGQAGPSLSLAALIELVGHRHSIWPTVLDLRPFTQRPWQDVKGGKGKGKQNAPRTLAGKKWYAKMSGETSVEPEVCDLFLRTLSSPPALISSFCRDNYPSVRFTD